uniref:Uncharacterized protein n=1 Tax=Timema cristinae TaxID=61476 RepID=A0A7R9DN19_TIMCR|nr:unnamed protein product [Timema cristinae]
MLLEKALSRSLQQFEILPLEQGKGNYNFMSFKEAALRVDGMAITKMTITLSYDRRAIAEDEAAEFLETCQRNFRGTSNISNGS